VLIRVLILAIRRGCEDRVPDVLVGNLALELKTGLLQLLAEPFQDVCGLVGDGQLPEGTGYGNVCSNDHDIYLESPWL
jgi:hypothetical protein